MSGTMKVRLFGLGLFVVMAGLLAWDWHELISEGTYHVKLSGAGPFAALGGLFLMAFPTMAGPPAPGDRRHQIAVVALVIVGLAFGGLNIYLLDHYHPPKPLDKVPTFTPAPPPAIPTFTPTLPERPTFTPPIVPSPTPSTPK